MFMPKAVSETSFKQVKEFVPFVAKPLSHNSPVLCTDYYDDGDDYDTGSFPVMCKRQRAVLRLNQWLRSHFAVVARLFHHVHAAN